MGKTWKEKLNDTTGLPRIQQLTKKSETGTIVIPSPLDVDLIMRKVAKGKLTTISDIRKALAVKYGTLTACPISTGIFVCMAANAANEDYLNGEKIFTPYWRTLRTGGMLNPQFPGGIRHQIRLLAAEGHSFIYKKKNMIVENYHWFITEDIYE